MAYVHMRRDFVRDMGDGVKKTYPSGWRGELDDDAAQAAIDGGYTRQPPAPGTKSAPVESSDDVAEADESMTRDQLDQMAKAAGLDPADYRTKADIVEAINAA